MQSNRISLLYEEKKSEAAELKQQLSELKHKMADPKSLAKKHEQFKEADLEASVLRKASENSKETDSEDLLHNLKDVEDYLKDQFDEERRGGSAETKERAEKLRLELVVASRLREVEEKKESHPEFWITDSSFLDDTD